MQFYSETEDQFIKDNYPTKGPTYCAKALGRTLNAIAGRRRTLRLPTMTSAILGHPHVPRKPVDPSKHKVPLEQFVNVTTPEVAYILGLLWADGYVHETKVV